VLLLSVTVWPFLMVLFHGVSPWAISRMDRRSGWAEQHPGLWNWPGLIFVALGAIVVLWFWFVHMRRVSAPPKVELEFTPSYLLTEGPYRRSRNPMYVAVLTIWFGWAVFYGSLLVLVGLFFSWLLLNCAVHAKNAAWRRATKKTTSDTFNACRDGFSFITLPK
jgi:protein-S-isoprenylcysteine O-methyltransferase Ste14